MHSDGICPYSPSSSVDKSETSSSTKITATEPSDMKKIEESIKKDNNINVTKDTMNQNEDNPDLFEEILTLGLLGGGGYWGYRKHKKHD